MISHAKWVIWRSVPGLFLFGGPCVIKPISSPDEAKDKFSSGTGVALLNYRATFRIHNTRSMASLPGCVVVCVLVGKEVG